MRNAPAGAYLILTLKNINFLLRQNRGKEIASKMKTKLLTLVGAGRETENFFVQKLLESRLQVHWAWGVAVDSVLHFTCELPSYDLRNTLLPATLLQSTVMSL